jgi:hypothetical protein
MKIFKQIKLKKMAKFLSTTFGKISGRHGTAVAAIVGGESVIRVFTPPSNPNTTAQQAQRLKFALIANFLNPLRIITTIGFGDKHGHYQAASLALRNAISGVYPDFSINYAKIVLSSGSLPQSPLVSLSALANMNVSVNWDKTLISSGTAIDFVYVVFLNPVNQTFVFSEAQAIRDNGTLTVILPAPWLGATIHSWLFFTSADHKQNSVSQYLGTVVPG